MRPGRGKGRERRRDRAPENAQSPQSDTLQRTAKLKQLVSDKNVDKGHALESRYESATTLFSKLLGKVLRLHQVCLSRQVCLLA